MAQTKVTMTAMQLHAMLLIALVHHKIVGIYGGTGIGKSSIPIQVAEQLGWEVMIWYPALKESVDFGGYPVEGKDAQKRAFMRMVAAHDLHRILYADKPLLVIIDELDKCDVSVMNAIAQIILSRTVNGQTISEHVRFVITGNRLEDKCGGRPQPEHLKARQCIIELQPDIKSWKRWALSHGVSIETVGYFDLKPQLLFDAKPNVRELVNTCNPRSAVALDNSLKNGLILDNFREKDERISPYAMAVATGDVGRDVAMEYLTFLDVRKKLPSVDQILLNPATAPLPKQADITYMLCSALVHRLKAKPTIIGNCLQYTSRMTEDFKVMFAKVASMEVPEVNQNTEFNQYMAEIDTL